MFKRCKVVMLPTNEKTAGQLALNKNYPTDNANTLEIRTNSSWYNSFTKNKWINQHLYITSDDKIEEDDWWLNKEANYNNIINDRSLAKLANNNPSCKKIIASTDNSLRVNSSIRSTSNDNYGKLLSIIARPSDSFISKFIEEYNKDNIITDVMVEYEVVYDKNPEFYGSGMFNSSEIKLKVNPKDNTITIKKIKDSWSREEVIKICKDLIKGRECKAAFMCYTPIITDVDKWLNDNL